MPSINTTRRNPKGGFALVIALSLMAFVLLLLMSITTLVRVESQSADIASARVEAEQAALLGLQLAIGDLQKAAGPDQRVTATADVLDAVGQPQLLGVWESYAQDNSDTSAINYAARKQQDFVQWLCSTTQTDQTDLAYADGVAVNAIELVGDGTVAAPSDPTDPSEFVSAPTVEIVGTDRSTWVGRYAWQVFDESQKANLTLNQVSVTNDGERISALGVSGRPGFQIDTTYQALESLSDADREKIVSLDSSDVTSFDPVLNRAFHYLTTDSRNLLVDVVSGGYQKDLSLLFENNTLPTEYANRHIYSESNTPLVPAPTRFDAAEPLPSPDPKWSLLHSHYKLYEDVTTDGGMYGIDASTVERDTLTNYFNEQQLLPVISNAQFIFSMAPQDFRKSTVGSFGLDDPYVGFLGLWVDVVVTLWNPYNVDLKVPNMEFEFYRFPLEVEFFRSQDNGASWISASRDQPVHIASMFNKYNNQTGEANVQDRLPYRVRIKDEFTLKPGEYRVFSPNTQTYNHVNMNYTVGLGLGNDWDPRSGGIFERYIAIDKDHNGLNQWPGELWGSAQIEVQLGDLYGVNVSPAKVDRNSSFEETNDEEVVAYLKVFQGDGGEEYNVTNIDAFEDRLNDKRQLVGAIEMNMEDTDMVTYLPSFQRNEMSQMEVTLDNLVVQGASDFMDHKVPFLIASLRLKTEQDSAMVNDSSSSIWLHNGLSNQYFTNGISGDQNENEKSHQYELTWEPMTSWQNIPTIEVNPTNSRGYGGTGVSSATGVEFAPYLQVPLTPAVSLSQFAHAPLNSSGQIPLTSQVVGNAYASPVISPDEKSSAGSLGQRLDHSYLANRTLFDSYFLSTAASQTVPIYQPFIRDLDTVIGEFFNDTKALPNPNFEAINVQAPTITSDDYATFAQYLFNRGAFNVNSTSVEAWELFLSSGTNQSLPILDMLTTSTNLADATASTDMAVSRFAPMLGDEEPATVDGQNRWSGHRRLTAAQIRTLAQNVVDEVKARGPFQSISEFVNRRLSADAVTSDAGALQTAIENSNLNVDFGFDTPKNNTELGGAGGSANSSDGAATQITQADLLNRLAPSITVRGDTFRIRTYGEVTVGRQTVKAWGEAVVQRSHEFVDDSQVSTTDNAVLNQINENFGRRFNVVSFRWLDESEI